MSEMFPSSVGLSAVVLLKCAFKNVNDVKTNTERKKSYSHKCSNSKWAMVDSPVYLVQYADRKVFLKPLIVWDDSPQYLWPSAVSGQPDMSKTSLLLKDNGPEAFSRTGALFWLKYNLNWFVKDQIPLPLASFFLFSEMLLFLDDYEFISTLFLPNKELE